MVRRNRIAHAGASDDLGLAQKLARIKEALKEESQSQPPPKEKHRHGPLLIKWGLLPYLRQRVPREVTPPNHSEVVLPEVEQRAQVEAPPLEVSDGNSSEEPLEASAA